MKAIAIAAIVFAAAGSAQTSTTQSQVFDFTNKPTQQGLQEIATILRTVGDIQQLSIDSAASAIIVGGTPDQLAMSGWIMHQLDQPVPADLSVPQPAAGSTQQYLVAGKSDDVIRVFHLTTVIPSAPQEIQEILTTLRTVADIQKVFNYTVLADLVVRGPAAQLAFAQYLIDSLDVKPGSVATSAEFQYHAPREPDTVARVFYLANASTPQAIQEVLTVLRTVADIQKVFCYTPLRALAIRGTSTDIAASDWLIQSLDIPAPSKTATASTVREYQMPGNVKQSATVIRVFYPTYINTPQTLNETLTLIRTNLQVAKAFDYSKPAALIVRGSADQIAKADQLIQNSDQPAKNTP